MTLLVLFWIAAIVIVDPRGQFPLGDDWAFSATAVRLSQTGVLTYHSIQEMLLLPQVYIGSAALYLGGEVHTTLRLVTLMFAALATFAVFAALRALGLASMSAITGAITIAANPVFFYLSFTFMSDVPTIALGALAAYAFVLWAVNESSGFAVLALFLATLALANRHSAAVVLAACVIGLLARRSRLGLASIAVGPLLALGLSTILALSVDWIVGLPELFGRQTTLLFQALQRESPWSMALHIGWSLFRSWLHLGLWILPFLLALRTSLSRTEWLLASGAVAVLAIRGVRLPLMGNIWYERGVGPILIGEPLASTSTSEIIWLFLTVAAAVGAASSASIVLRAARDVWRFGASTSPRALSIQVLALAWLLLLLLGHSVTNLYDRYVLFGLVPLVLLVAVDWAKKREAQAPALSGSFVVLALASLSVLATADSLDWSRARWDLIKELERGGVDAAQLDGGFEYNGSVRGRAVPPESAPGIVRLTFGAIGSADVGPCRAHRPWLGPRLGRICATGLEPEG